MAKGVLRGGSPSLINALIGFPYEIDFTHNLVYLVDAGEAPY
ncbi:hypothetical protein [Maribacter algicola]|nr:hypothetical protein [Maribacter algicola]